MTRFRAGATTTLAVVVVLLCAYWDLGVPAAAVAGVLLTAALLLIDSFDSRGGVGRHVPALIAGGSCTVLAVVALVPPVASGALVVVAGLAALVVAFRLTYSARRPR
ncbi:hypothetical protein GCM10022254_17300 [Actinomadura meridiana]|uniref:Phosphatidate cytidylyltransferase n=1 Tax=Actinomadura meridiana TaxID=559626 RepID=A0ABP8BVZ8_9ACTN